MAKHVISRDFNNAYFIKRFYDDWTFTHQSDIDTIGTGMIVIGGNNQIDLSGTVKSNNDAAIRVEGNENKLHIHKVGLLSSGGAGISLMGSSNTVFNDGVVTGTNAGIFNNQDYALVNTGKISGAAGLLLYSGAWILNEQKGSLSGLTWGVHARDDDAGRITLTNHGFIGGQDAYYGSNGVDRIVNDGNIDGDVNMRDGKDWFDNRGGSVNGAIYGGDANDTLITDNANVILNESVSGGNNDTVKSTVSFTLTTNVERLVLLGSANINATGNSMDNRIIGNDGDNILTGGEGADTLTGGGGNDVFAFHNGAYRDVVTDFTDGQDKLNITGYDAIVDFDDIKSHMMQVGDAVIITFSGVSGDHVVLQHVNINQIDSSDFVFG